MKVWVEDKGSLITIKNSWIIQMLKKLMEKKKRVKKRFGRESIKIPDL